MRRRLFMLLALITLAGSLRAQTRAAESARVYSAAFDVLFHQGKDHPDKIVLFDSTTWDVGAVAYNGRLLQPHESRIDSALVRDFEGLNRQPRLIDDSFFSYPIPRAFISIPELHRLDTLGKKYIAAHTTPYTQTYDPVMYALSDKYPRTWGITSVSVVGFDKRRTHALVLVSHLCGHCYSTETFYLEKKNRAWHVVERIPFRNEDGVGPKEVRYLGANARERNLMLARADSTKKAMADSLALDRAPRRIRGTVVNRRFGAPLGGVQIFLHANRDQRPFPRFVTDSKGRYEIRNPPLGTTMLEVQCPGSSYAPGTTLDAPSFYVFPAMDTVIDMGPPDLQPCWAPRKTHRLDAGRLAESEASDALASSPDEAAVYRTVVESVLPREGNQRTRAALKFQSVDPCIRAKTCGLAQLSRLQALGIINPSTVSSVRALARNPVAFSAEFARANNIDLITPEDVSYLRGEGDARLAFEGAAYAGRNPFWEAFESAYPGSSGILTLSKIGFNDSHTEAVVEVSLEARGWSRKPELMLLKSVDGKWQVVRRHIELEKNSGTLVSGRCVLSTPASELSQRTLQTVDGLYRIVFATDFGTVNIANRTVSFIPDSITRKDSISRDGVKVPARRSALDRWSSFGVASFVILNDKGKRNEGLEVGVRFFSGSIEFPRYRPAFMPDGVYLPGIDIEVLDASNSAFGGRWVENDDSETLKRSEFSVRSEGHFCAERIGNFVLK